MNCFKLLFVSLLFFEITSAIDIEIVGYCKGKDIPYDYIAFKRGNLFRKPISDKTYICYKVSNNESFDIQLSNADFIVSNESIDNKPNKNVNPHGMKNGECCIKMFPGETFHFFSEMPYNKEGVLVGKYLSFEKHKFRSITTPFDNLSNVRFEYSKALCKPVLSRIYDENIYYYRLIYRNRTDEVLRLPNSPLVWKEGVYGLYHNKNKNRKWLGVLGVLDTSDFLCNNTYATIFPSDVYISSDLLIAQPYTLNNGHVNFINGENFSKKIPLNEIELDVEPWKEYMNRSIAINKHIVDNSLKELEFLVTSIHYINNEQYIKNLLLILDKKDEYTINKKRYTEELINRIIKIKDMLSNAKEDDVHSYELEDEDVIILFYCGCLATIDLCIEKRYKMNLNRSTKYGFEPISYLINDQVPSYLTEEQKSTYNDMRTQIVKKIAFYYPEYAKRILENVFIYCKLDKSCALPLSVAKLERWTDNEKMALLIEAYKMNNGIELFQYLICSFERSNNREWSWKAFREISKINSHPIDKDEKMKILSIYIH